MSNDGGSAFPVRGADRIYLGMSLRDWFASAALVGISSKNEHDYGTSTGNHHYHNMASTAYCLADAMLAERERTMKKD